MTPRAATTRGRGIAKRPDELDDFKRRINLTEYAATLGYAIDRKASSRNSAVMVHPAGDKVIVAKNDNGHWIYFSIRDPADHGSIVDFVQRREGGSLGEVRKRLRPWSGGAAPTEFIRPAAETFSRELDPVRQDLVAVRIQYEAATPIDGHHAYLEHERKIPWHTLTDPIFADRVRVDARDNAVFPHFNYDGICGFELKNHNFTGFAPGGTKGLWCSRASKADRRLVIAETAVDALSHASLRFEPGSCYISTAGELNPAQPLLLKSAMEKLPDGGQVVLAVDHDAGGDKIGARIKAIFDALHRPGLAFAFDRPAGMGKDWNDVLRTETATPGRGRVLKPRP